MGPLEWQESGIAPASMAEEMIGEGIPVMESLGPG